MADAGWVYNPGAAKDPEEHEEDRVSPKVFSWASLLDDINLHHSHSLLPHLAMGSPWSVYTPVLPTSCLYHHLLDADLRTLNCCYWFWRCRRNGWAVLSIANGFYHYCKVHPYMDALVCQRFNDLPLQMSLWYLPHFTGSCHITLPLLFIPVVALLSLTNCSVITLKPIRTSGFIKKLILINNKETLICHKWW